MSQPENQPNQPQGDLASELRELGQQLETAVRAALTSDKAKQVQQDMSAGMKEIGVQLQGALKAIQDNPRVQEVVERGEQAVNQAQQSQAAKDFQEALARGIAQLNEQLAAFATNLRQSSEGGSDTPPPSEPATGETVRLDPDQDK
ncbi:MAG: hypothetical protein AB4911_13965 [Oscillochloridaceae bacterium umkhey_bin13]